MAGPVVLVGQSYGGAVISNVAADAGEITGLVYVCAFAATSTPPFLCELTPDEARKALPLLDRDGEPGSRAAASRQPLLMVRE